MGRKAYPLQRIRYWWAYDIDEVCTLYNDRKLHKQTVRDWIKKGLPAIKGKPILIYGHALKEYLGQLNASQKCETEFDHMFCMSCKDAKPVYQNHVELEQNQQQFIRAKALCRTCKKPMNKSYTMDDYPKLKQTFHVVDVLPLYDSTDSTLKTHIQTQSETPENESSQGELF